MASALASNILLSYRARQTNLIYHWDFIRITSERLLHTGLHSKMKQFNISGSLVNAEEKEQASESGKPRPDFNFKVKFVLTMLNITI